MADITFYTHPYSRGRIVRWMLEETGLPYDVEIKDFGTSMKAADYLAINPMGKVPAIRHGSTVVTEVAAICAYLAELVPDKALAPAVGSRERGTYYRWMFFVAGPLEMATTAKAFDWKIDAENARAVGCGQRTDAMDALESALKNKSYICGDHFTAADLLTASYLGWGMMQKTLEERPVFLDYVARMNAREASVRASGIDDALAAKAQG